jgi:general stress protein 26
VSDPAIAASWSLVKRSEFVLLSTLDETDGSPDARLVFNLRKARASAFAQGPSRLPDGFGTWIATNTSSKKVRELRADPRGCLYYADTANFEGLTLQGVFEEVADDAVRAGLWVPAWEMFYPGGLDGGDFSVFLFHPWKARHYHGLRVSVFDPEEAARDLE